jgi:hypothetical protein
MTRSNYGIKKKKEALVSEKKSSVKRSPADHYGVIALYL